MGLFKIKQVSKMLNINIRLEKNNVSGMKYTPWIRQIEINGQHRPYYWIFLLYDTSTSDKMQKINQGVKEELGGLCLAL